MTVSRWLSSPLRKIYKRSCVSKTNVITEFIKVSLKVDPFASLFSLRNKIKEAFNFSVSRELLRVAIKRLGLTKKKAKFFSHPLNLEEKTRTFLERRDALKNEKRLFVSIDETSFGRRTKDVFGYSQKGNPLVIPKAKPYTITQSALCLIEQSSKDVIYKVKKGSFNTDSFVAFLEDLKLPPTTVLLLDNVAFHHSKRVKELCLSRGWELLYTPPYSPWFNPIEGVFKRHYYEHQNIQDAFKRRHIDAFFDKSLTRLSGP